jgi:hypothetical protein
MVSPAQAAKRLNVNRLTVVRWCHQALDGLPTKLRNVERSASGLLLIPLEEVDEIKRGGGRGPAPF